MSTYYYDFDLYLEYVGDQLHIRLHASPVGQSKATTQFSIELDKFKSLELLNIQSAKWLGASLFGSIFTNEILTCLRRSEDYAESQQAGLRIRLHLEDPQLINIPWEYLYDPTLDRFICTSSRTPITRYLDLPFLTKPLFIQPPIKVLVVISSPNDYPKLDAEREWQGIQNSFQSFHEKHLVKIDKLEGTTFQKLQNKLLQDTYHIIHFIGHGEFDENKQESYLLLEDDQGKGCPVYSDTLGILLQDSSYSLRLVFLNTCKGGRTSTLNYFSGIAQTLVQKGIPAVIAMQSSIHDNTAILLGNTFYPALLQGNPVDAALAEARKAIYGLNNRVGWGNPVLYLRVSDGKMFEVLAPNQPAKFLLNSHEKESRPQLNKADPFASLMLGYSDYPGYEGMIDTNLYTRIKNLALLGTIGAGKSTFLSVFYLASQLVGWQIRAADDLTHKQHLENHQLLFEDGAFPQATRQQDITRYCYDIYREHELLELKHRVLIEDLSGEWFVNPLGSAAMFPESPTPFSRLLERTGILLLIDPFDLASNRRTHNLVVINFLGSLLRATNWERNKTKISPKLAVCLTKMDEPPYREHINYSDAEMFQYVSHELGKTIVQEIFNACEREKVKFFGISSIGLNAITEKGLSPDNIAPVNVFAPIEWLLT